MKKGIFVLIVALLLFGTVNVSAMSEVYYTNANGVELTEKEYNFIEEFYGEGFVDKMTPERYEFLKDLDINNNDVDVNSKVYYDRSGSFIETPAKRVSIAKGCTTSFCTLITSAIWLYEPKVKSYDVIGARFLNASLYNKTITTYFNSTEGTKTYSNYQFEDDGFGNSVKIGETGTDFTIDQKFYVKPNGGKGTVYASYQHAGVKVSLATSKLYKIEAVGYGNVFNFYGAAEDCYDATPGVDMSV